MSKLIRACRYGLSDGVPRRSLYVALVVGTILNLINQGDALFGLGLGGILRRGISRQKYRQQEGKYRPDRP